MIQNNLTYNPKKDYKDVDQFGFVDLNTSLRNGFVPASLEGDTSLFNGIQDPASIVGKPSDNFEVMRMEDGLSKAVKEHTAKAKAASESKAVKEHTAKAKAASELDKNE